MKNNFVLKTYIPLTNILSFIIFPIVYFVRILQKKDVSSWKVKFGLYELPKNFDKTKKTIMIHGVSVGEVVSLEKLVKAVKNEFKEANLVLTTGTKTGQETAIKKMGDVADFITYFPFDINKPVKKFLETINPDLILIAETEIWPVFAYHCKKNNIPLFIINGRMSDESFRAYKKLSPFFKRVLPLYKGIYVQSGIDKERIIEAGGNPETVEVMKNLKFDVTKFEANCNIDKEGLKILLAGSTHNGEDEIVLDVYKKLKENTPNLRLLLAPRHITRTEDVIKLLNKNNLSFNRYSINPSFKDVDVLLLDVMGELAKLYSICDIAFIGGSFNKTGGHNPLEAIIFDKPVISGPSIKNFRDIYSILCSENAGKVVNNKEEFFIYADKLLTDEEFYKKTQSDCSKVFNNQQGALDFVINKIRENL